MDKNHRVRRRLRNMYLLAMSDENLDAKEQNFIARVANASGLSQDELFSIIDDARDASGEILSMSLEDRVLELYELAEMVWVDGRIEHQERAMFTSFVGKYGFLEENVEEIATFLLEEVRQGRDVQSVLSEIKNS